MTTETLPTITGKSDAQIAYATAIRDAIVLQRELAEAYEGRNPEIRQAIPAASRAIAWQNADARYWLDTFKGFVAAMDWTREEWTGRPDFVASVAEDHIKRGMLAAGVKVPFQLIAKFPEA